MANCTIFTALESALRVIKPRPPPTAYRNPPAGFYHPYAWCHACVTRHRTSAHDIPMYPISRACRGAFAFATIALLSATLTSCRHDASTNAEANASILVASGGGYAGVYSGYRLLRDGRTEYWVQAANGSDSLSPMGSLGIDTVDYLFARLRYIGFHKTKVSQPGNLTKIIRYVNNDVTHESRWGDAQSSPPVELESYYQDVMKLMKSRFPDN